MSGLWTQTHTHTQLFNGPLSRTTQVGRYQKKHSPTHTHADHQTSFIKFLHFLRSIASSVFNLCAWQSFSTTSLQVLFSLPLGLGPSASCSIHFFTQSSSSFHNTCPSHHSLFCVIPFFSSIPLKNFSPLLTWKSVFYLNATHPSHHSHLCWLKCQLIFFPYMNYENSVPDKDLALIYRFYRYVTLCISLLTVGCFPLAVTDGAEYRCCCNQVPLCCTLVGRGA